MKTVLITGAAGSIGSELTRKLSKKYNVIALDQDETRIFELNDEVPGITVVLGDVRSWDGMVALFKKYRPNMVFHCAALKHVTLCEKFPEEAYKTNVEGTANLAHCAFKFGTKKFVFVSTDKAVNPFCVMGNTKKEAEEICMNFNKYRKTKFMAVRFGNVLVSRGSVIPIFQKQIAKGGPVTVTDEKMERYFMTIFEATDLIIKSAEIGKGGEIFMLDMGKPRRIFDLAVNMVEFSGKDIPIQLIGRRPGEKLFEELYDKKTERAVKTPYKGIIKIIKKHG